MSHYKPVLNLICILLFIAGIIGMLLPGGESGSHELRWMAQVPVAGHMLVFFLGAYLAFAFIPGFSSRPLHIQAPLMIATALLAGIAIEGLQTLIPGRTPSFRDIAANTTGSMAFLSLTCLRSMRRHFLLPVATVILAGIILWPLFKALADDAIAFRQFPLLAGFETPFEATRFIRGTARFSTSSDHAFYGNRSLRVQFGTQSYSGIALQYMPGNWRGYSHLQFAVYNPGEKETTLHLRIHDAQHENADKMIYADRFNRTYQLPPGEWSVISIPLSRIEDAPRTRKMDMNEINSMGFFVAREPSPLTLYIDDIRLK